MLNKNAKKKQKTLLLVALAILFACGIAFVEWSLHKDNSSSQSISPSKQKEEITKQDNSKKSQTLDISKSNTGQSTYTPPTSPSNIILETQRSGDQLILSTKLNGYSDGSCTLTITNGSKHYSKTASVIYQQQFSTCAGFSIPIADLGTGNWHITLAVTSGSITTTKTTIFEVK